MKYFYKLFHFLSFFLLFVFCGGAFAQIVKYGNEFTAIGVGARQLAAAGSQTAYIGDIYSVYWNPAGLTRQQCDIELGAMHNEYYAGMASLDFLAIGMKATDSTHFAISMLRFGNDNIPNTLELIDATGNLRLDKIKSFSAVDYEFLLSIAHKSKIPDLRLGGSCKIIRRTVGDFGGAWGFGFDFGAQYKRNDWLFGAMLFDATSTFTAWWWNTEQVRSTFALTGNALPQNHVENILPRSVLAIGRSFIFFKNLEITPSIEAQLTFDGKRNVMVSSQVISIDPRLGVETSFKQIAFLRFGVKNFQKVANEENKKQLSFEPCLGVGLRIKRLFVDYALTNMGAGIGLYSNVFSLRYNINKKL